ncbi:BZ3500_MvSof-1268-A1-R1_Chr1-3g02137 [Microbotryum saponariae]|uniref:BZ3500_MvSof-1268-A1-R1_Chr1-3g02137 protein n=1 Tax=Microbotryum saponariae TaxID=289078 RepID=A0A2X0M9C5_9BASI|nr:BZ3500_MvSof-1268-A1-R1_Chr1-3g02137 [Microbotryum saponariae]SCZ95485.1 BZ3501_MvSof-1269-A2-R1_Chr1-3g01739 [Microbotryum saponariae]
MARERRHVRHVAEPSSETRRHTNTTNTRPAAQAPLISFQQARERALPPPPPPPPALTRANEARLPPGLPPGATALFPSSSMIDGRAPLRSLWPAT